MKREESWGLYQGLRGSWSRTDGTKVPLGSNLTAARGPIVSSTRTGVLVSGIIRGPITTLNVVVFGATTAAGSWAEQGASVSDCHPTQRCLIPEHANAMIKGGFTVAPITDAVAVMPNTARIGASDRHCDDNVRVLRRAPLGRHGDENCGKETWKKLHDS